MGLQTGLLEPEFQPHVPQKVAKPEQMEALERKLLWAYGIPDPYEVRSGFAITREENADG